jgi:hypothetical protein
MPGDNEPTLVLTPPARQGLVVFAAVSGVCIAVGFFMALASAANFLAWLALGFAGVIGLCAVAYLLPASSTLILSPQGFTVRFASRAVFYSWNEVEHFAVAERSVVAFRLSEWSQRISPAIRQLTGYDGALPAAYGSLPPEALAAQLNECRSRLAGDS